MAVARSNCSRIVVVTTALVGIAEPGGYCYGDDDDDDDDRVCKVIEGRDRVTVAHQHKIGHLVSYLEIQ